MGKKKLTIEEAVQKYCLDCSGDIKDEVKKCPNKACTLYPFRIKKKN
jgi:hypothetical protein